MKKFVSLAIVLVMVCLVGSPVFALQGNFKFSVSPTEKTVKPGEEVEIDLKVSDVTAENDGIVAVQGDLSQSGSEIIEGISINGKTNWSVELNEEENSELKGRFVLSNMQGIKENQTIGTLKVKIKSDAKAGDVGYIYLKNVHSSYAKQNGVTEEDKTNSYDVKIKLTVQADLTPDTDPTPDPDPEKKPTTPDKKPTQKPDNTIADKEFSDAGIADFVLIAIVIGAVAVVAYIKNKNCKVK